MKLPDMTVVSGACRSDASQIPDAVDIDAGHLLFGDDGVERASPCSPIRREPLDGFHPDLWRRRNPDKHPIPRRLGEYAVFHGTVRPHAFSGPVHRTAPENRCIVLEHPIRVLAGAATPRQTQPVAPEARAWSENGPSDARGSGQPPLSGSAFGHAVDTSATERPPEDRILFPSAGCIHLIDGHRIPDGPIALNARLDLIHQRFVGLSGITNLSAGEPRYDGSCFYGAGNDHEMVELRFPGSAEDTSNGSGTPRRQGFVVFAQPRGPGFPDRAWLGMRTLWRQPRYNPFSGLEGTRLLWRPPTDQELDAVGVGFAGAACGRRQLRLLARHQRPDGILDAWYLDSGPNPDPDEPGMRVFWVRGVEATRIRLALTLAGLPTVC